MYLHVNAIKLLKRSMLQRKYATDVVKQFVLILKNANFPIPFGQANICIKYASDIQTLNLVRVSVRIHEISHRLLRIPIGNFPDFDVLPINIFDS